MITHTNRTKFLSLGARVKERKETSHWVRDVTFGKDLSQVRKCNLPQMMAALRSCVINLFRLHNFPYIPDGFDFFAARPFDALAAIGC
jgi:hypothetical protein